MKRHGYYWDGVIAMVQKLEKEVERLKGENERLTLLVGNTEDERNQFAEGLDQLQLRNAELEAKVESLVRFLKHADINASLNEKIVMQALLCEPPSESLAKLKEQWQAEQKFPDIGTDPLKHDDWKTFRSIEAVKERIMQTMSVQQKEVPDQTALVWRIDLMALHGEHTQQASYIEMINRQQAEQSKRLEGARERLQAIVRYAEVANLTLPIKHPETLQMFAANLGQCEVEAKQALAAMEGMK